MANPEHLAWLKKGVEEWNRWRESNPLIPPDLSQADLNRAKMCKANLRSANLSRADLSAADLREANLAEADLEAADLAGANLDKAYLYATNLLRADLPGANLSRTMLRRANLTEADIQNANLQDSDITDAKICGANLAGANFNRATIGFTSFANVDLSEVSGLDSVKHDGPSSIGIDTIYMSGGNISRIFLRGAGVPESFIEYIASLVGSGIEFYSLFISYSHKDEEFAERLHADLQANGVRCWYAPEDMPGGKKLHREIDEAIRVHDKLLLILSRASMVSEWVMTEISKARKRELRDGRQVLFPIRLCSFDALRDWECFDADTGKDSAREIREYFIPDFSNWDKNHDAYKKAFDRLLKDMKQKSASAPA
jgi:uncharacterized protein YjbI with pentapeptide repeats